MHVYRDNLYEMDIVRKEMSKMNILLCTCVYKGWMRVTLNFYKDFYDEVQYINDNFNMADFCPVFVVTVEYIAF